MPPSRPPPTRPHAPFAARVLAFTLAATALFDMLVMFLQRRAFAGAASDRTWEGRSGLFSLLEMASGGGLVFAVLLACLAVLAALRYRRDMDDPLARNLALGAAVCLGLEAARQLALELITTYSGPANSGSAADWATYVRWWYIGGVLIASAALALVLGMAARAERTITGRRPSWVIVGGGALVAYFVGGLIVRIGGIRRDPFAGFSFVDVVAWLGPVAALATAVGLVIHAGRIRDGEPAAAWGRAAAGLERYKDATALRVLIAVLTGLFLVLGRSGLSPLVLLGILCTFALVGIIIALFQIAGLVRLADAPATPLALAVALSLFGLGVAFECVTLVPVASFVLDGGHDFSRMPLDDLPALGLLTQGLGLLTAITLLLALRRLAVIREAPAVVRRCTVLLVTLLATIATLAAAAYVLPNMRLHRDGAQVILLVSGASLLMVGVFMLVSYFRTLTLLHDAMTRRVSPDA